MRRSRFALAGGVLLAVLLLPVSRGVDFDAEDNLLTEHVQAIQHINESMLAWRDEVNSSLSDKDKAWYNEHLRAGLLSGCWESHERLLESVFPDALMRSEQGQDARIHSLFYRWGYRLWPVRYWVARWYERERTKLFQYEAGKVNEARCRFLNVPGAQNFCRKLEALLLVLNQPATPCDDSEPDLLFRGV